MQETRQIPDFFCLGAPRAGTTWLFEWLHQHPEVCIPQKEIHFFIKSHGRDYFLEEGMDWYLNLFSVAEDKQILGDVAAGYLRSEDARKRILSVAPNAKMIVMLRNPVERFWSDYQYCLANRSFNGGFEEFMNSPQGERALADGFYFKQISEWLKLYPKHNFHFVILDDVNSCRQREINKICDFLGVNHFLPRNAERRVNEAKKTRFIWLARLYHKAADAVLRYNLNFVRRWFRALGGKQIYFYLNKSNQNAVLIGEFEKCILNDFYRGDVRELGVLLGRDLSHWQ